MRSPRKIAQSAQAAATGQSWGNSRTAASVVMNEEQADSMLGDSWVTLVSDDTQAPGHPQPQAHRILCHPSDLEGYEKFARANGYQVRFEPLRPGMGQG